jgi:hypothetical protein
MDQDWTDLAARFRVSLDEQERAHRASEEARLAAQEAHERRLEQGRVARNTLLDDLQKFAEAMGHLDVQRSDTELVLSYRGNRLAFIAHGDGDEVNLEFEEAEGGAQRLYREAQLENRWVWSRSIAGRQDRVPFYMQGLETLMTGVLKLPRPSDQGPAETS